MSDWIGLGIIAFLVLCGLFALSQLSKPYNVTTEEFEKRAQEGPGLLGASLVGLQKALDYLPADALRQLYAQTTVFAYPSRYEGFGLPVLEAMHAGIPVLTTRCGGLADVAGDAALVVNPDDAADIARGLARLLTDTALRQDLIRRGHEQAKAFSWRKTVDLFLQALHSSSLLPH